MSKINQAFKDDKFYCFKSFFLSLNINIEELCLEKQSCPINRWKNIVAFMYSKEKEVDIKQNAIYNVLELVLEKSEALIESNNQEKVIDIILNIVSLLYDKKFEEPKDKRDSFIIATIKWSNNVELINELSLFVCLYLNASNEICTMISESALVNKNKLRQFYVNSRLVSKDFINGLTELEYKQIINSLLKNKRNIPLLNEDIYKTIRKFCDYDMEFFLSVLQYTPFFLDSIEEILEFFSLEQLKNMSLEQIRFLCNFRNRNSLFRIKALMSLNISINEMEEILENPSVFELVVLGLPLSKAYKILHYPSLINYIYQKIITLKSRETPLYSEYKALLKTN